MQRALTLTRSTIGKKVVMALSGLVIAGFTVGHMLGNMTAYSGAEAFNGYAETIKGMTPLLWGTRIVLLVAVSAHIYMAYSVVTRNLDARPDGYMKSAHQEATPASRSMAISGTALLLYIVFHLIHFTIAPAQFTGGVAASPFYNFYHGFKNPVIVGVYMVGNIALGVHLFHGIFSAMQSLGVNHKRYNHLRRDIAIGLATLLTVCNLMFPISVMADIIPEPDGYPTIMDTHTGADADGSNH